MRQGVHFGLATELSRWECGKNNFDCVNCHWTNAQFIFALLKHSAHQKASVHHLRSVQEQAIEATATYEVNCLMFTCTAGTFLTVHFCPSRIHQFPCHCCEKTFSQQIYLDSHIKKRHVSKLICGNFEQKVLNKCEYVDSNGIRRPQPTRIYVMPGPCPDDFAGSQTPIVSVEERVSLDRIFFTDFPFLLTENDWCKHRPRWAFRWAESM